LLKYEKTHGACEPDTQLVLPFLKADQCDEGGGGGESLRLLFFRLFLLPVISPVIELGLDLLGSETHSYAHIPPPQSSAYA
jgi:hypothetical protein